MVELTNTNKHKLKLLRFWLNRNLKPYIRIEPKISHLNIEYFKCKELNKIFYDENLSLLHDELSINDILVLNLPLQDKLDFLNIFHKEFMQKIKQLKQ